MSSQNMHGLFCTILKQEDSKLDVPVVKLNDWLSEVSIECKLINENNYNYGGEANVEKEQKKVALC